MRRCAMAIAVALFGVAGCAHTVKVAPVDVNPIKVTVDVNVKVDRKEVPKPVDAPPDGGH